MAGAQIGMSVRDADRIGRALNALMEASGNLRQPFEEIGAALRSSTEQRFEDEVDPEGDPWEELTERTQNQLVTRRRKRGPDHILRRKGLLYQSLTYAATHADVAVGSNRIYAAIHQLGGTDDMDPGPAAVPARPFLGVSDEDEREIEEILMEHLQRALR